MGDNHRSSVTPPGKKKLDEPWNWGGFEASRHLILEDFFETGLEGHLVHDALLEKSRIQMLILKKFAK